MESRDDGGVVLLSAVEVEVEVGARL